MIATSDELILAIDMGTQSVRAVLFDLNGNTVDIEKTTIEPFFTEKPGYAEQEPEYYWSMFCRTTRRLLSQNEANKKRIQAVTVTSQRGTVINLDKNGRALRPAIVWPDQRRSAIGKWPGTIVKQGLRVLNIYESVTHAMKSCEARWIMKNEKDLWKRTHKFLFLSGYINYRLTNSFVDSIGSTVGYVPFDYKKHRWEGKKSMKYKMFPIDEHLLADLVPQSERLGIITLEAAIATGIPEGLPLIAAAADKACEVLGSGCLSPEIACLSYGTTATVQTTSKKYTEVIPFFPPYPAAVPGMYNTEMMIYRGFWMISWFKNEFGHREIELSKDLDKEPEELFDEMIKNIPPGSLGLTLQPYWSPGVKVPGTEAKGAIIGFGDVHTRAHTYRSILEGLAYALKEGMLRTQRRTKVKISKIRVSGGGSQGHNVMQLTADIFNLPAEKPHTYETSALGAAINATVGMGLHRNFETAVKEMCRVGKIYHPIQENVEIYNELFTRVYLKMYQRLKPLYDEIREITNYPEIEI